MVKLLLKWSEVAQLCLTLCDLTDCSLQGSSVRGILHARLLEWVAISFSRGSSGPRDQTQVSHIAGRLFTIWATREVKLWFNPHKHYTVIMKKNSCLYSSFLYMCIYTV